MTREEAIKAIKAWDFLDKDEKEAIETLIPELKESEDKNMKNWILDELRLSYQRAAKDRERCEELLKAIAWLEKQKPIELNGEDEMVKQAIIDTLNGYHHLGSTNGVLKENMIAWLEKQGKERKITHEEICKSYNIPDIGEFSDGYHTFNSLYKQRMILFAVLVKTYKEKAWKSWKHEDGEECFGGGWFIVGIDTPQGSYTYHYKEKYWGMFDCIALERAKHWDGHTDKDVERLLSL